MHFKMLFAICFILDQSKILLSGNGLNADSTMLKACCINTVAFLSSGLLNTGGLYYRP